MKTARGQQLRVLGKVNASIKYKDQQSYILLYLCPDLEQVLYLGIAFWRMFGLAPDIIGVAELDKEKIHSELHDGDEEYKMKPHILTE